YWLAPTQVKIISVAPDFNDYCQSVAAELEAKGVRVELDVRHERIGYKIREAGMQKIPYLFILGANEQEAKTLSVRPRGQVENVEMTIEEFINTTASL
ncbi:MAG: threonine--tRNA ligase, partial [Vallitaleaceae bacterium]|nr:threonine--tRNA ligase [Vallitaleaceae bacterium]